jgi:transposase
MSKMDYDIELRAVDFGMNPREIAEDLGISLDSVLTWFKANGLSVKGYKDYNAEASARLLEVFSPFETVNS